MNLHKTGIVISREYLNKVKKKSFLITTFLVPILFAAICVLPSLLMMNVKEKSQKVAVVDYSGIVMPYFESNEAAEFTDCSGEDPAVLKDELKSRGFDVLVVVSQLDSAKSVSIQTFSKKPTGVDFNSSLRVRANKAVEQYRIGSYQIAGLDQIMKDVKADVKVNEFTLDESGNASVSESGIYMIISMVLGMLIYMFIAMFGGSLMSSVIEEKSSRVVEVLVSSVKATELMFGKIIPACAWSKRHLRLRRHYELGRYDGHECQYEWGGCRCNGPEQRGFGYLYHPFAYSLGDADREFLHLLHPRLSALCIDVCRHWIGC